MYVNATFGDFDKFLRKALDKTKKKWYNINK